MNAQREATVIAVFQRSLYLRDDEGRIACLGGVGLGAGPLNGLCDDWPERTVTPGTRGAWRDRRLILDTLSVDASRAADWQGAKPSLPVDQQKLVAGLVTLAAIPARGLGRMIVTLVSGPTVAADDRFQAAAFDGLTALVAWLRDPGDEPMAPVARLIGLGPGLTPAGDDALGGAMIAARLFGHAEVANRIAGWLLPRARSGTSDISFAHLEAAADGEGAAALHDTLLALSLNDEALNDTVARLDRIGHSSGWDALAGAVAALTCLCLTRR